MEEELPNLPDGIIFDILSRLPVKPLCRFKSVSKPWLALITEPHFIKSHLTQSMKNHTNHKLIIASPTSHSVYSVDYQPPDHTIADLEVPCTFNVEIMGSCNGVVLLGTGDELCLWNPSIRMYRKFSQPEYPRGEFRVYGLGYDSVSNDFKVVRIVMPESNDPCDVHMFTSKLSSWKQIGDIAYSFYQEGDGAVVNGMPHWLWMRSTDGSLSVSSKVILAVDTTEEKFREVPQPNCEGWDKHIDLGFLSEWLCVVQYHQDGTDVVWVMKEYGVKESWTKLFVVPNGLCGFFMPLCYAKDGGVVMVLEAKELGIYNPKENSYVCIGIPPDCVGGLMASYVESLLSPHGGNRAKRRWIWKRKR
ncbi:hypothetical protein RHMOL_Rhmol04G0343500 [Rhododendron molle]|uniref:Uncharacterized protein n=1 Tax=Rhododendron molle TaxID=49168 RepID=A0ACC0P8Z2_RHOML|nr:hypothetical protein RHMOL_Rhmol04G0343500 [Rhododendron molle]